MPFIHVSVNQPLSREACAELREKFAIAVTLIPGKTRENSMIRIEPDCFIEIGDPGTPCADIDVRLLRSSPKEAKAAFVKAASEIMEECCGVPAKRLYIQFFELEDWGSGGILK